MSVHRTSAWLAVSSVIALAVACSSENAGAPPESNEHPSTGGTDVLILPDAGASQTSSGGVKEGTGGHSSGSKSGSGSTGSGSTGGTGSDTGGAEPLGGWDEGGSESLGGRTIDLGTGGEGNSIDVGSGGSLDLGSGGSLDLGTGGSLDLGTGGSLDLGTGGSIDLGTGGTIDTCVPECIPDELTGAFGELGINVIVFHDADASGCDVEGRMWVGGDATFSGFGVGAQLATCDAEHYVLVVGGSLEASGGINGSVWVGGDFIAGAPKCGTLSSELPAPVDFAFLEAQIEAYSDRIATYVPNGTTDVNSAGVAVFKGNDPDMNVFQIDAAQLAAANGTHVDVPATSTAIINVVGGPETAFMNGTHTMPDGVTCGSGGISDGDFCNNVLYNMPTIEDLYISGTAVQGTILAPRAKLNGGGAQVNGQMILDTYDLDGCVEAHPHYFTGCLCLEGSDGPEACCP